MASKYNVTTDAPYPVCNDLAKVASLLREYGVCVIPNVFSNSECDNWMKDILSNMELLSGNQVTYKCPELWTRDKLPPQVRDGLHHHIINNIKPIWEIRRDPRMKKIFTQVYTELRGHEVDEFVCSIDGMNIQPNISRNLELEKDWPHCDQTAREDIFKCVQGQVVLTNTEACFRASPTSHKHFVEVMEAAGIPDNINSGRFTDHQIKNIVSNVILPNKIPFQLPIKANKGSVILWFSTTIHSAKASGIKETPTNEDPFKGWRGVVYVCYRPRSEFSVKEIKVLEDCLENNDGTNHWSNRVFSLHRYRPYGSQPIINPTIRKLIENPKLVYQLTKFKPEKSSFLIREPMNMTTCEERFLDVKSINISSIENEKAWPSLGNGGKTETSKQYPPNTTSQQGSLSIQRSNQGNRKKKVNRINQNAGWSISK